MPRTPYIAANWKMNKTIAEAAEFIDALLPRIAATQHDVVVCPPFTALHEVVERRRGTAVRVAAQNMHFEDESGAFTGEISAPMLVELDVEAVVLGHSERRQFFGETDEALAKKVPGGAGRRPRADPLRRRVRGGARRRARPRKCWSASCRPTSPTCRDEDVAKVVIAYEPIWAIGTGKVATPEQAQEACAFIRDVLRARGAAADDVRILYGGSVKPGNAAELLALPDVDGALVGGAALVAEDFAAIVEAA